MKTIKILVFKTAGINLDDVLYSCNSEELKWQGELHPCSQPASIEGIVGFIQKTIKEHLSKKTDQDKLVKINISFLSDFEISHVIGMNPTTMIPFNDKEKKDFWKFYNNSGFHQLYMKTKK